MDTNAAIRVTGIGSVVLYQAQCSHYHIAGVDLTALADEVMQIAKDRTDRFSNNRAGKGPEHEDIYFEYGEQSTRLIEAITALGDSIDMQISSRPWAQVHHLYESCNLHDHVIGGNDFSFVFYVKASPGAGKLYFDFGPAGAPTIEPVEGMLIMFPSYFKHGVTKNLSNDLRISIAGDFRKKQ
jgi:hypothetical protein